MIREEKRNWLKSSDVKSGDVLKIVDEGKNVTSGKFTNEKTGEPKIQFVLKVLHNGQERDFTINSTNDKTLIRSFGQETKGWIGKEIKVDIIDMMIGGSMKKSIVVQGSVDTKNTSYEA